MARFSLFSCTFYLCLTLSAEPLSWRRRPSSIRASVVRKLGFLRNRCMDPGQILWVAPSPPYLQIIFFSSVRRSWYGVGLVRRPSVRPSVRPSIKPIFSGTVKGINTRFGEKLPVHHTFKPFVFQDIKNLMFYDFLFVSVNMGPYGSKNFKRHHL